MGSTRRNPSGPTAVHVSAVGPSSAKVAYTISQAVGATGIGRTTLYELIRAGHLEARKLGRRTLIPAAALDALIAKLPSVGSGG